MRRHALSGFRALAFQEQKSLLDRSCFLHIERTIASKASEDGGQSQSFLSIAAARLLAAAALTGASYAVLQDHRADCAAELPLPSANPKAEQFIDEFRHWLRKIGADSAAIDFRPCSETPEAGLAVYTSSEGLQERLKQGWWQYLVSWIRSPKDFVLATVPLEKVVTVKTIIADEKLGPLYAELLHTGKVDERQLIMLFLMTERIRGSESTWFPWINLLPQAFNTPIFYGKAELAELKGTTLFTATQVLKDSLRGQWTDLQPLASRLLKAVGPSTQGFSPTFNDFIWAYSVFWSRSITFPDPQACPNPSSTAVEPREGIIPGIDFCNHNSESEFRWSVWNTAHSKKDEVPDSVSLVTSHRGKVEENKEITINYGDKSNEELLHLYGFTIDNNPNDALMIICPPPETQQAAFAAKMRLLQSQGLSPQLFLTAADLQSTQKKLSKTSLDSIGLSSDIWDTLEILTMDAEQALHAERSFAELPADQKARFKPKISGLDKMKSKAKVLAQLTSLQHLLELKLEELEGPESTTSLEQDVQILEAADSGTSPLLKSCVVYRAGQKRLARGYLDRVNRVLAEETGKLLDLQKQRSS